MRDSHGRFTDQYRHGYHNQDNDTDNYYNRSGDDEDYDRYGDYGRGNYIADYDDDYYDDRGDDGYTHDDYTREYDLRHRYGSGNGFEQRYSQQYGGSSRRYSGDEGSNNAGRNAYYSSRRNNHYLDSDKDTSRRQSSYSSYDNDSYGYDNDLRHGGYSSYSSRGNNDTRDSRNGRYGSNDSNSSRSGYSSRSNNDGRSSRSGRYGSTHGSSGRNYSNYTTGRYSGDERNPLRHEDYLSPYYGERSGRRNEHETLYSFGGYDTERSHRRGEERMPLNSRAYYYDDGRHDNSYRQERDGSYTQRSGKQGFASMDKDRLRDVSARGGRNSHKRSLHRSDY